MMLLMVVHCSIEFHGKRETHMRASVRGMQTMWSNTMAMLLLCLMAMKMGHQQRTILIWGEPESKWQKCTSQNQPLWTWRRINSHQKNKQCFINLLSRILEQKDCQTKHAENCMLTALQEMSPTWSRNYTLMPRKQLCGTTHKAEPTQSTRVLDKVGYFQPTYTKYMSTTSLPESAPKLWVSLSTTSA